jgi:hypothetical protein
LFAYTKSALTDIDEPGKRRAQCLDLFRSALDCQLNFSNFTHLHSHASVSNGNVKWRRDINQVGRLRIFFWSFFQPSLRGPNTAVALIYKGKNVVLVFRLEFGKNWIARVLLSGCEKFRLQPFGV